MLAAQAPDSAVEGVYLGAAALFDVLLHAGAVVPGRRKQVLTEPFKISGGVGGDRVDTLGGGDRVELTAKRFHDHPCLCLVPQVPVIGPQQRGQRVQAYVVQHLVPDIGEYPLLVAAGDARPGESVANTIDAIRAAGSGTEQDVVGAYRDVDSAGLERSCPEYDPPAHRLARGRTGHRLEVAQPVLQGDYTAHVWERRFEVFEGFPGVVGLDGKERPLRLETAR